ncbi:hypothetical protein BH09PSE6_BH09PSE6_08170 [soil metagenome]
MLALFAMVTSTATGCLAVYAAKKTPEKAKEMQRYAMMFFGIAVVMALIAFF